MNLHEKLLIKLFQQFLYNLPYLNFFHRILIFLGKCFTRMLFSFRIHSGCYSTFFFIKQRGSNFQKNCLHNYFLSYKTKRLKVSKELSPIDARFSILQTTQFSCQFMDLWKWMHQVYGMI